MSDQTKSDNPVDIWREQPEERLPVDLNRFAKRRTEELSSNTRSEILMSIGAALLLVGVGAWRLELAHERLLELGFAAAVVWVAISLYAFRRRIWRAGAPPRDAVAASGLEYYRRQLELRRDHLRNEWLWHGPLALAAIFFLAVCAGRSNIAFQPLRNVLPLLLLLAAWTAYGIWRRRVHARDLQREIDEISRLGQENGSSRHET
jgi:hypothetical protein